PRPPQRRAQARPRRRRRAAGRAPRQLPQPLRDVDGGALRAGAGHARPPLRLGRRGRPRRRPLRRAARRRPARGGVGRGRPPQRRLLRPAPDARDPPHAQGDAGPLMDDVRWLMGVCDIEAPSAIAHHPSAMKVTYYGHSALQIETSGTTLLFDPFITGNKHTEGVATADDLAPDVVALTHAHADPGA